MTHGKTLSLQHITVKMPGRRVPGVSRSTTAPNHFEQTDSLSQPCNQSDHSNSTSPTPYESSLDLSGSSMSALLVANTSPRPYRYHRETTSPDEFSSSDTIDDPARLQLRYEYMNNGRGHNRNSSMDENIMLQQLRTGGISYTAAEEMSERAATLSRIQTKKSKEKNRGYLSVIQQGSEEQLLSEGECNGV